MRVTDLPARVPAGHTFTLREVLPLAVWQGVVFFQRQMPGGSWETLATAPISPRVFWLHWKVPAGWAGSQIAVRFVLQGRGELLATSSPYTISVASRVAR